MLDAPFKPYFGLSGITTFDVPVPVCHTLRPVARGARSSARSITKRWNIRATPATSGPETVANENIRFRFNPRTLASFRVPNAS
jgi:hypothetical protein